jgi:hypothetical protein
MHTIQTQPIRLAATYRIDNDQQSGRPSNRNATVKREQRIGGSHSASSLAERIHVAGFCAQQHEAFMLD